jgi:TonB family protein
MEKEKDKMWRSGSSAEFLLLVLCAMMIGILAMVASASAQTYDAGSTDRKVVKRIEPDYPDTLKRLYIGGIVRVEVTVAANGSVVNTKLVGGSPILGQAAMKAIHQWKFVPAAAEQTVTVKIDFDPHR